MSLFPDELADALAAAETVAVLTGAGASAESGIATFRDPDGLWEQFSPEELANVEAFLDNPTLVQGWYRYRQEAIEQAEPNPGHRALTRLEELVPRFACITQNVDNLHQEAGTERVIELHGNIIRSYCVDCGALHQLNEAIAKDDPRPRTLRRVRRAHPPRRCLVWGALAARGYRGGPGLGPHGRRFPVRGYQRSGVPGSRPAQHRTGSWRVRRRRKSRYQCRVGACARSCAGSCRRGASCAGRSRSCPHQPRNRMTFAYPWVLWGLGVLPLWAAWHWWRGSSAGVSFPTLHGVPARASWRVWMRRALPLVRGGALALLIVALARPQQHDVVRVDTTEGIDLVLALDASTSMRAADFPPNRFEAARTVAADFVEGRPNDRIGLVVFAGRAFTQAPLTTDSAFLTDAIEALRLGRFERGTAIGAALATSINRLRGSEAPSRVVVLLTDGQNNRGSIDPLTAAEIARVLGIRVYTIGVGAFEADPFAPEADAESDNEVDESTLMAMAEQTGGQYFRASDTDALRTIYNEIAEMEQGEIETTTYTNVSERYTGFALGALLLVLLHTLLRTTAARQVP